MLIFELAGQSYAEEYRQNGFVHLKNVVCPKFLDFALTQLEQNLSVQNNHEAAEWEIVGKKRQFLFEFPDDDGKTLSTMKNHIARITGANSDKLTLSERHLHTYAHDNGPDLPVHKDRLASQYVSLIPLSVPDDSRLKLYLDNERDVNNFVSAKQYRDNLDEEDRPEVRLQDIEPLLVQAPPGDVLFFSGSSTYHGRLRRRAVMYLTVKFNTLGLDPLAADPGTAERRHRSLELLEKTTLQDLLTCTVDVSPRVHRISRHYQRPDWQEVLQVYIWNDCEFSVDKQEFEILRSIEGERQVSTIFKDIGASDQESSGILLKKLQRLVRLGGLDIIRQCSGSGPVE